eukprot:8569589-Karenia_brevis.AAC.1
MPKASWSVNKQTNTLDGELAIFQAETACEWPRFGENRKYIGPLPQFCRHKYHEPLIRPGGSGKFKTSAAAADPAALCKEIATAFLDLASQSAVGVPGEEYLGGAKSQVGYAPQSSVGMATKETLPSKEGLDRKAGMATNSAPSKEGLDRHTSLKPGVAEGIATK